MKKRIIIATLKEPISVANEIEDVFKQFDWLQGASIIEDQKRDMLNTIKSKMHEKISTLSMDDISYEIN